LFVYCSGQSRNKLEKERFGRNKERAIAGSANVLSLNGHYYFYFCILKYRKNFPILLICNLKIEALPVETGRGL
jgi:hypothetical protein